MLAWHMTARVETIDGKKTCSKCKEIKTVRNFKWRSARNNYHSHCRACESKYRRTTKRNSYLRGEYGITESEYRAMLDAQDGVCAICGGAAESEPNGVLSVDHCHSTLRVRGLLCLNCNIGIGRFGDNPDFLEYAADYLRTN